MLLRELAFIPATLLRQYSSPSAIQRRKLRELDRTLAFCRARVPITPGGKGKFIASEFQPAS
jgi:hypothetical protein